MEPLQTNPMIELNAQIEIAAEPTDVAGLMFDPNREAEWIDVVKTVTVIDAGISPGARVERTGRLMGHEFSWATEVVAFHFPHMLELRVADAPVEGTVTFHVVRSAGGTTARIRVAGNPGSLSFLPVSMITGPATSMLEADLGRLKDLVEQATKPRDEQRASRPT